MSAYLQNLRAFSPSFRRLLVTTALAAAAVFGINAVLYNLYLIRLGFTPAYIGLLAGLGQLAWAAAALPAGFVSRAVGLRRSIEGGMIIVGLAIALTLSVEWLPRPYWEAWLLGCQVVLNIGVALVTVHFPPYIMAVTEERERAHAFAVFTAIVPVAALTGSLLAGSVSGLLAGRLGLTLDTPAPYRLALWLSPLLCFLCILPLQGAERGYTGPRGREGGLGTAGASRPPYGLFAFWATVVFAAAVGESAVRTFYNVYLDTALHAGPAVIGTVMGVAQLLPIAAALALPLILGRWGTGRTYAAANGGMALCLAALALATSLWPAAAAYIAIIALLTLGGTSRDMLGQELVIPRWRTTSQGVAMIGMALGGAAAAVAGGLLIDRIGFGALFLAGAAFSTIAAALLLAYPRTRTYPSRERPAEVLLPPVPET